MVEGQSPKKVKSKPKAPANHPPYKEMVVKAIIALKERNGSSRQKILNYIRSNNKVNETMATSQVRKAILALLASKDICKSAKSPQKEGANGYFKLVKKEAPKKKPAAKKPAKKATTPKKAAKKVAKKPSSAKKAAKKPAKKTAPKKKPAKKVAKKTAAKKPAAKKVVKKTATKKKTAAKKK